MQRIDCAAVSLYHRDRLGVSGDNFGVNAQQYSLTRAGASDLVSATFSAPKVQICDRNIPALCDDCVITNFSSSEALIRFFNHTYLVCSTPAGMGGNKYVRVVVGGQSNNASEPGAAFAYHAPEVLSLSAYSANTGTHANITETITVTGKYFGSPSEIDRISLITVSESVRSSLLR